MVKPTSSENDQEFRSAERYLYKHHLDITYKNKEWPALIIDWSQNGIQVNVNAPLDKHTDYRVEFSIHRMSFISDEEFEDEDLVPPVEEWSRDGEVRWIRNHEEGFSIGILFEEGLEELPLPELPEYITDGDLCILQIYSKTHDA